VEIGCGDCGHNYEPEEFKELKAREEAASRPERPEGDRA